MSRRRTISEEERALLERAMRAVKPLRKRAPGSVEGTAAAPAARLPKAGKGPAKRQASRHAQPVSEPARGQRQDQLGAVDRRTEQKLKRGRIGIDATVDLHGLTQSAAHKRLNAFIIRASEVGHRRVLVITGKGGSGGGAGFMPSDRRGVLRESVPRWIAEPPLRDLVWGLKPAGPRHGGEGALYVLLKRERRAAR